MKSKFFTLIILAVFMSSCTDQMIEPEIIPTRSIRDLTYKDVPNVVSQLQEGLGLRGGNDRLSVNDEGRTYGVIIDWNRITELIDTVGNVNYTFAVVDEDEDPYTFHNLIIGKNEEGYWKRPYLLTYVMGEEFRSKYDATGSTEGFTGRLLKRYISPSTSDSRRGVVNNYEDPYTSNDPCDRETEVISVGSGGGDDPYTEFEAPTPGMGNTFCYSYWYYFELNTICDTNGNTSDCEVGVSRPFLVTECIEYGGSVSGSDPCDQDKEEVAIIGVTDPCKTTKEDLKKVFTSTSDNRLTKIADAINKYAEDFGLDNKEKLQHFLAQAGHESASFTTFEENLNYGLSALSATWPSRFNPLSDPTADPDKENPNDYKRSSDPTRVDKEKLANSVYGNRMGNDVVGDGYKYRGRGVFQLTGKDNYQSFTAFYQAEYDNTKNFVTNPDLVATDEEIAILSALWFYKKKVMDKVNVDSTTSVEKITKKINGKKIGLEDRESKFLKAKDNINCH